MRHAINRAVNDREHGLDALRVFAFAMLILYHAGMAFTSWGWHLQNAETSRVLEHGMLFVNRWRLPLLFFISGAGIAFALRRRTFGALAKERVVRLFIPLVFGMLVIVPPQIYFERIWRGVEYASYAEFYKTVFEFKPYPEGGALSWHHLWFVAYVLIYALASIPVFALLRRVSFAPAFERHAALLYAIPLPAALVMVFLGPHWPTTHGLFDDWANLLASWLTFLWGYIFATERRLLDLLMRRRRELAIAAVVIAIVFFVARAFVLRRLDEQAALAIWHALSAWFAMLWVFALVGNARALVTRGSRFLAYANEAVYPFYIVHQTITVALVYALLDVDLGEWPKFALAAFGTFAGSLVAYEVIRRITPLRPLFGLKLR